MQVPLLRMRWSADWRKSFLPRRSSCFLFFFAFFQFAFCYYLLTVKLMWTRMNSLMLAYVFSTPGEAFYLQTYANLICTILWKLSFNEWHFTVLYRRTGMFFILHVPTQACVPLHPTSLAPQCKKQDRFKSDLWFTKALRHNLCRKWSFIHIVGFSVARGELDSLTRRVYLQLISKIRGCVTLIINLERISCLFLIYANIAIEQVQIWESCLEYEASTNFHLQAGLV